MFGGDRRGIAGVAIRQAAVEQVRLFSDVIRTQALSLKLVGVGGISSSEDVRAHLDCGAHAVQIATAAMLDPAVGLRIRESFCPRENSR